MLAQTRVDSEKKNCGSYMVSRLGTAPKTGGMAVTRGSSLKLLQELQNMHCIGDNIVMRGIAIGRY